MSSTSADSTAQTSELNIAYQISSRIKQHVPLKIDESGVKKRGQGVFVLEGVKAAEPIFSVEPLLTMVNDGKDAYRETCDHCSDVSPSVELLACKNCKTTYYCDEECKNAAWKHHHQYECIQFAAFNAGLSEEGDSVGDNGESQIKLAIRLLQLHFNGAYPKLYHEELQSLPHIPIPPGFDVGCNVTKVLACVAKSESQTTLAVTNVECMIEIIFNNDRPILKPRLQPSSDFVDPATRAWINSGHFVDPFVSKIEYACDANAFWFFNGNELRIRALKDIAPGDEITFCYVADKNNYYGHRAKMKTEFGIPKCRCRLCFSMPGLVKPSGIPSDLALHTQALNLLRQEKPVGVPAVEAMIVILEMDDFTYSSHFMHRLHWSLMWEHLFDKDTPNALKVSLKIYLVIEPMLDPPILPHERLDTLSRVCKLMEDCDIGFPGNFKGMFCFLTPHFRRKLAMETVKWFGGDSVVAQSLMQSAMNCQAKLDDALDVAEQPSVSRLLTGVGVKKENLFMLNVSLLLQWADLQPEAIKHIMV